jgi:hypothetical protein
LDILDRLKDVLPSVAPGQRDLIQTAITEIEQLRAHVDNDGQLNHRNGVTLLAEVERARASEQRLYDALFILMGSLPPASLAGQHCHVCDPQAGERLRNIADAAMKAASCCTFTNSTSDLTYERNRLRARLEAACTLLRRTLPMHYRGLTIDADIQAFLAEIKTEQAQYSEESCPGHVASDNDAKVCGRCGIHIDSLRPPEPERE